MQLELPEREMLLHRIISTSRISFRHTLCVLEYVPHALCASG